MATADFLTSTARDGILAHFYIEIEGIRVRYGDIAPSWNPEDSGTNRPIKEYFSDLPQISGQVAEPLNGTTTPHTFSVNIIDMNEEITTLFSVADTTGGQTTLAAAITTLAGTAVTVDDGAEIAIGDDIYIDRETMRVTNVVGDVLTVSRGMYGSTAAKHPLTDDQNNPRSVQVYTRPPFLYTREVVLCEGRTDLLEADVIKLRGYLESVDEMSGVYTLKCAGYLRRLNTMICESLAETKLVFNLWDEHLAVWESAAAEDSEYPTSWVIGIEDYTNFQASGYIVIDEEVIRYEGKETMQISNVDVLYLLEDTALTAEGVVSAAANRGLFAAEILGDGAFSLNINPFAPVSGFVSKYLVSKWCVAHYRGAPVREIFHSQRIKDELALADQDPLNASDVILTMLLSKEGDDANDATYDKLPQGWGAGIESAKIDKTDIQNICSQPSIDGIDFHPFAITEAVDCKEWLEENILRPCHLFFVETEEGKITVRRLYSKNEASEFETATALTEDDLLDIPRFKPGQVPLGEFSIDMNYHPGADSFLGKVNVILADGRAHYMGTARKFDLECKTLYDSRIGYGKGKWLSGALADLPEMLAPYMRVIWANFATVPCPVVSFPVSYAMFAKVQVGQVITLTSSQTPNLKSGSRGITAETFQVVESTPEPVSSTCRVVAWMIGVHEEDTRLLAPAAKVKSWDAVNHRATLYDDTFTDGIMYTYDIDAFAVDDDVMFVDGAYDGLGGGAPEHGAITAIHDSTGADDGYLQFAGEPTDPPVPDNYIVTGNYVNSVAAQKAKWAYLADTDPDLNGDAPHKYER